MAGIGSYDRDDDLIAALHSDGQPRCAVRPVDGVQVILGRGSDPRLELQTEAIAADNVPVLRRQGGGCAVVLDPGNLLVSAILPLPGLGGIKSSFRRLSAWLIEALAATGVSGVDQQGISDLALAGRKIGGSCIHRSRDLLYYATTLLVAPDLELVERYLRHPPREPAYRRGRPHREFMGSLAELAGVDAPGSLGATLAPLLQQSLPSTKMLHRDLPTAVATTRTNGNSAR